uniref:Rhodanese domain-containing protein n=1 Tax=viral metagenome TaxID=1070528 RepID=A0A6C0ACY1_9ZZZZ
MKTLKLDIRNSHELDCKRFYKDFINIPAENIKYNIDFLKNISKNYDKIDIYCKSGRRARIIKQLYFKNNTKFSIAEKHFSHFNNDEDIVKNNYYCLGLTRSIQIIAGILIILILFLTEIIDAKFRYLYLVFGTFMLYVGISGNCFISSYIVKY